MNRKFLNNVNFKNKVNLNPDQPEDPVRKKKKHRRMKRIAALLQLFYLIFIILILWFGGQFAIVGFVNFCKGENYSSWKDMTNDYQEYRKNW